MTSCNLFLKKKYAIKTVCAQYTNGFTLLYNVVGSFVVVDDSGREEAVESGRKVACVVVQVLFHEQVRALQKSPGWLVSIFTFQSCILVFILLG